jgi:poly-gamma-glutamate synthesis protein (capsule biosynthesis protein)
VNNNISIIIAGDLVPTKANEASFRSGNIDDILGDTLVEMFQKADFSFLNLECPLVRGDNISPIIKSGPNLKAHTDCMKAISKLNPKLIGLANNHVMDYGEEGLEQTIDAIARQGIDCLGVGNCLQDVNSTKVVDVKGVRVGIFVCAEKEFSCATDEKAGANPYDPLTSYDTVSELKSRCDYCIVIYHGGLEYYQYATREQQKRLRKFIDVGADFVTCQHTHCISEQEDYNGGYILYGQGNFVFYGCSNKSISKKGIVVSITGNKEDGFDIKYIFVKEDGNRIIECDSGESAAILHEMCCRENHSDAFRNEKYNEFCDEVSEVYLHYLSACKRLFFRIDMKLGSPFLKMITSKKTYPVAFNIVQNETHREVCMNILERGFREQ